MPPATFLAQMKTRLVGKRDRVRLTGRHYQNARKLLLYTVDLLHQQRIPYHVVYGTLLGLARDGDLIPWDVDVDVMIHRDEVARFRRALWRYRLRGWRVCDKYPMAYDYAAWARGDVNTICIKRPLLLDLLRPPYFRTGRRIMDIFVRYSDGDSYAWDTFDMVSRAPRRFFDGYETIRYAGRDIHVPRDYREFLELVYGSWQVPNAEYDPRRDDGTLVRDSVAPEKRPAS